MRHLPITNQASNIARQQDIEYIILPEAADAEEKGFKDYLSIIRKRKWFFIIPLFIIPPFVALDLFLQKPAYMATATVHIEKNSPNIISIEQVIDPKQLTPDFFLTEYEIIKSRHILDQVVEDLQLYQKKPEEESYIVQVVNKIKNFPQTVISSISGFVNNILRDAVSRPENNNAAAPAQTPSDAEEKARQRATLRLRGSLQVRPRPGTQLVDIRLINTDAAEAAQQVNAVAHTYVRQNLENRLDASRKAIVWLTQRAAELKKKINDGEAELQAYKAQKKIAYMEQSGGYESVVQEKVKVLQSSYVRTNSEREALEVHIAQVKRISRQDIENMIGALPEQLNSPSIEASKIKYIQLKNQYSNLSKQFGDKHPKIIRVKTEIDGAKNAIYDELSQLIASMEAKRSMLYEEEKRVEKEIGKLTDILVRRSNDILEFDELNRELKIDRELYLTVTKRLAETTLTEALETNNIKVVELAAAPGFPVESGKKVRLVFSVFVALGFGAALGFVREYFDRGFRSVEEAERSLGIGFLGFIPSHKTDRNRPITLHNPATRASEAYRILRTWIQLSFRDHMKTMLITSAFPGEGKSHTAANLAISFAQLGQTVLIIDADLRRPKLHHFFNVANHSGLVDVLARGAAYTSVLQDSGMENLKVIPTGGMPHNPSELLSTRRMQNLLREVRDTFDLVIVDAPITLSLPDVAVLIPAIDSVLLVHDPRKKDRDGVLEAKKILDRAGAHLLGMVFNNVNLKGQKHYYYHYDRIKPTWGRKRDTGFVDMRPTENRSKWVPNPHSLHDAHNNDLHTS